MNNSIVMQLQEECHNSSIKIDDLLLKSKTIAYKLNQPEPLEWIESELKGYDSIGIHFPKYRNINCQIEYLHMNYGWLEVTFKSREMFETISQMKITHSIAEIISIIDNNDSHVYLNHFQEIVNVLRNDIYPRREQFRWVSPKGQFENIIYQTRSKILDWTLELEKAGVLGEGLSFSPQEKKDAIMPTHQIFNGNTNIINGDVAGNGSIAIHQSSNFTIEQVNDLLQQIEGNIAALPESCKQPITDEIEQIKHEITSGTHDKSKIRKSLESIKKISESASGNLLASGIKDVLSTWL
jgi:hypothetical protein